MANSFLPTTFIYDVNFDENGFNELLIRLRQDINNISSIVNVKDTGYYDTSELICGQLYFPNPNPSTTPPYQPFYRSVIRKVIDFGSLPNAGAKAVNHSISVTANTTFTRIYGTASDTTGNTYIPLPFSSPTLNENIKLEVSATQVIVTTAINYSSYNQCYIVLEYIEN